MEFIQIEVERREATGSSASGRLRRDGLVPGVLYGLGRPNISLQIPETEIRRFLKTGSQLVELRMGGKTRPALLQELQVDAIDDEILHADFARVDKEHAIETDVPIVFKGRAKGIAEGGDFMVLLEALNVRARPAALPKEVEIEVASMEIGDTVHVSDIQLPDGVTALEDPERTVCTVATPKIEAVPEPEVEEAEVAEGEEIAAEGAAEGEGAEAPEVAAEGEAKSE